MGIQFSDRVENIVGIEEIAMSNFFFSHTVFKSCPIKGLHNLEEKAF